MDESIDFDVIVLYLNKPYTSSHLDRYLTQIYEILRDNKGLHKLTLMRYLKTNPLFIKRLMDIFATNDDYITLTGFISCIRTIYTRDFELALEFTFNFLSLDGQEIAKCDMELIYYHMLKEKTVANMSTVDDFVSDLLGCTQTMSFDEFRTLVLQRSSDPMVVILLYFYERKPFTISSLEINNDKSFYEYSGREIQSPTSFLNYFIDYNRFLSYISTLDNVDLSLDDYVEVRIPQTLVLKNSFTESVHTTKKQNSKYSLNGVSGSDSGDNLNNTTRASIRSLDVNFGTRVMIRDKNSDYVWVEIHLMDNDLYYRSKYGKFNLLLHLPMVFLITSTPIKKPFDDTYYYQMRLYNERYYDFNFESKDDCSFWIEKVKHINNIRYLEDHYVILKKLATGVSSQVRVAEDKLTGKTYVVKTISKTSLNKKLVELAYNELYILQTCKHHGIVSFIEYFESVTAIDIVMECLDETHQMFLKNRQITNKYQLNSFLYNIAESINYYQRLGIVHRDIKPSNICISQISLQPKIIDFGVSDLTFKSRKLELSCGTGMYISPEVYLNKPYDHKVDVWAFGILVFITLHYYLDLVNESTFRTELEDSMRNIIYHKETFNMTIQWGKQFQKAQKLISKCLERNANYRYGIDDILRHCLFAEFKECIN
jgi:tRNA A-37 threonylcarbamoyl transferase component Bud32